MAVLRLQSHSPLRSLGSLATLVVCLGAATCTEPPVAAGGRASQGRARISFTPAFSAAAASVLAQRGAFPTVTFDHVHVVLSRSSSDIAADTTLAFTPETGAITLDLTVQVKSDGESFDATIDYTNNGVSQYRGRGRVQSHAVDQANASPQQVDIQYVGIGANATRLVVAPKTGSVIAPATVTFTATVLDANGASIPNVPLAWSSSDASAGSISSSGIFSPAGKRATVTISARTPTNVSDNAALSIVLPASGVTLVSGGGQSGRVGTLLPQSATVRVVASDGVGISGATVTFSAPAGGRVGASSVVADANGVASTTLTLGTVAGTQTFAASAASFSVSIPETATPGDPATIAAVSGGGQSDTVKHALKSPFVAKVSDSFGNGVPRVTVNWSQSAGTGHLAATSSVTDNSGLASVRYTLGDSAGSATIVASTAGVSTTASFMVNAVADPIIALSTNALSFAASQTGANPPSQSITITNGGAGTLSGLQAGPITYGPGASGWLQTTLSGSVANPSATLTVQAITGSLSQGTYSATFPISSTAARNSQVVSVTFAVGPAPQLLTVTSAGNGAGTVSSSPTGISCTLSGSSASGTCRFAFPFNSRVTLSATPAEQSAFSGWNASGCSGTSPCTVTMSQPISVAAAFTSTATCTLTLAANPSTAGSVSGGGTFPCGTTVTATATANSGSAFVSWSESGVAVPGAGASYAFVLTKSRALVANFAPAAALTVQPRSANPGFGDASGTITGSGLNCVMTKSVVTGTCAVNVPVGAAVSLTATPSLYSKFLNWGAPCGSTCSFTITGATTVQATFDAIYFPVTVSVTGTGTISSAAMDIQCTSCSQNVPGGSTVDFEEGRPSSDPTWIFAGFGGACTGAGTGRCNVTVTGPITVTGTFLKQNAPTTTTSAATAVQRTSATLNGCIAGATVFGPTLSAALSFDYGTSPTLSGASNVSAGTQPLDGAQHCVTVGLTGLAPNTTYYVRLRAAVLPIGGATATGSILSFITPP